LLRLLLLLGCSSFLVASIALDSAVALALARVQMLRSSLLVGIVTLPGGLYAQEITLECVAVEGYQGEVIDCDGRRYARLGSSISQCEERSCDGASPAPLFSNSWWISLACSAACILCAAVAAGLTLGMTSLDEFNLKVLCNRSMEDVSPGVLAEHRRSIEEKMSFEREASVRILPVIAGRYYGPSAFQCIPRCCAPTNNHYLLVTLLVANACSNEALPVVFDNLVPTWLAVLLSVTVVLVFGEIIPSAIFTGPNQLSLASAFVPIVDILKVLALPVVLPISLLLDKCVRHDGSTYSRADIKALVRTLQGETSGLDRDEANMISGVLEMRQKSPLAVGKAMSEAKMIPHDMVMSDEAIQILQKWGHSRILVYRRDQKEPSRRDDVMGVLLLKKILGISPKALQALTVADLHDALKTPVVLGVGDNLLETLNKFQEGMVHIGVVSDDPETALHALREGRPIPEVARPHMFCSMEDVLESMLKEEIFDEVDAQRWKSITQQSLSPTYKIRSPAGPVWVTSIMNALSLQSYDRPASGNVSSSDDLEASDREKSSPLMADVR